LIDCFIFICYPFPGVDVAVDDDVLDVEVATEIVELETTAGVEVDAAGVADALYVSVIVHVAVMPGGEPSGVAQFPPVASV
jgi:hypothetical protein